MYSVNAFKDSIHLPFTPSVVTGVHPQDFLR